MGKTFTDRSADRIADAVRAYERQPRDHTDLRRYDSELPIPVEICPFEMTRAMLLPQNGPGVSWGYKLRWDSTLSHVGLDYAGLINIPATEWWGDVTDVFYAYSPDAVKQKEKILLLDLSRRHSAMATVDGDVGKYGIAWKPAGGWVRHNIQPPSNPVDGERISDIDDGTDTSKPFWSILTMQTPGMFTGTLDAALLQTDGSATVTAFRSDGDSGHTTWDGYDPFGPNWSDQNGGFKITVANPPAKVNYMWSGDAGDVVICRWNMRENLYYIIAVEPA